MIKFRSLEENTDDEWLESCEYIFKDLEKFLSTYQWEVGISNLLSCTAQIVHAEHSAPKCVMAAVQGADPGTSREQVEFSGKQTKPNNIVCILEV